MSKESKRDPSEVGNARLVIAILFILIVAIIGLAWVQGNLDLSGAQSTDVVDGPTATTVPDREYESSSNLIVPRATATAPLTPTAIATSVPVEDLLPLPAFENPVNELFKEEAEAWNAQFLLINEENSGVWQYEAKSFVHPIALEVNGKEAFLIDAGRVLALSLERPEPPDLLLSSGDEISGVRVLEPLDLALTAEELFVLDRAGDVYRYDFGDGNWRLDRYDRPVESSSGHYFVAIDVHADETEEQAYTEQRTLLETNYKFAMQYMGEQESIWKLSDARSVDVTVVSDSVYVLQRGMFDPTGIATKYSDTRSIDEFDIQVEIDNPRQIVATETAVSILDREGMRLLTVDSDNGSLLRLVQLPQYDPVSVFAIDPSGRLYLAGRDRLYFFDQPERLANILGGTTLTGIQFHDPLFLQELTDFTVPIGGSNITFRDFQMPGAPRHYRLGVHEGLDLYWQPGTKVVAAADGQVIRADIDYVDPTAFQLGTWWNETQKQGFTTREILDLYMGRQVWIQHKEGLVSRYGHLQSIEPGILVGVQVARGQVIGEVGNSGSPASLESERADAHLHFELWLEDTYLGQFMRPIEAREWIEKILPSR